MIASVFRTKSALPFKLERPQDYGAASWFGQASTAVLRGGPIH
jgi:hypothetical protein